jgi:hypothetical protein
MQLDRLRRRIDAVVEATHPNLRDEVGERLRARFDASAEVYEHSIATDAGMAELAELAEEVAEYEEGMR